MQLLFTKRFLPFFMTQCLGAFNDNLYKNILTMAIVFGLIQSENAALMVNVAALLFIFPFFLFSALGGELGEKLEKSSFIRKIKLLEIGIMVAGTAAIFQESVPGMLFVLFMLGFQSAIFGPVKYAIIPQHLKTSELMTGNSFVEMGTFLAILLGTLVAGHFASIENGVALCAMATVIVSVLGYVSSTQIPEGKPNNDSLKITKNIFKSTIEATKILFSQPVSVSRSAVGNSWFWFLGAVLLTQLPILTKDFLSGSPEVVSLMLAVLSVSIGIGSMLSSMMSKGRIEIGLVPVGSVGISVFTILLYQATKTPINSSELMSISSAIDNPVFLEASFFLFMIGVSAGLYIVPLYALIQSRSDEDKRSRVIGANNVLNALFMVGSAILSIALIEGLGLTIPEVILTVGVLNLLVNAYLFYIVPEFILRFVMIFISRIMYRVKEVNVNNIPETGPAVVTANHVSFMDALILGGTVKRPIRFIMYYKIYQIPVIGWLFKMSGAIPIAGFREDPKIFRAAFEKASEALKNGEVVGIFPEGMITHDGEMNEFKKGLIKIIDKDPCTVYPYAIKGMYGSFFSRSKKRGLFKRFWSKIEIEGSLGVDSKTLKIEELELLTRRMIDGHSDV